MEDITDKLLHINETLAAIRSFRPGWRERYLMEPCMPEQELLAFELAHSCVLPTDYREFLRLVGSAGPGPDCGIFSPLQHFPGSGFEDCLEDAVDLSLSFPHSEAWNGLTGLEEGDEDWKDSFHPRHVPGSLIIGDRGCGSWTRIIITGPLAGEIWYDERADSGGLLPALSADGERLTFLPWYLNWLEAVAWRYAHAGPARQPRSGKADPYW